MGPLKYRSSIFVSAISGFIVVVRFLAAFSLAGETMPENFQLLSANDDLDFVSQKGVGCRTLGTSKKWTIRVSVYLGLRYRQSEPPVEDSVECPAVTQAKCTSVPVPIIIFKSNKKIATGKLYYSFYPSRHSICRIAMNSTLERDVRQGEPLSR